MHLVARSVRLDSKRPQCPSRPLADPYSPLGCCHLLVLRISKTLGLSSLPLARTHARPPFATTPARTHACRHQQKHRAARTARQSGAGAPTRLISLLHQTPTAAQDRPGPPAPEINHHHSSRAACRLCASLAVRPVPSSLALLHPTVPVSSGSLWLRWFWLWPCVPCPALPCPALPSLAVPPASRLPRAARSSRQGDMFGPRAP